MAEVKPPLVRVTGANVKKAPDHRRRGGRGGMNGCNLFKQYKKYCIISKRQHDLALDDFVKNLFDHAKQIRDKYLVQNRSIVILQV